MIIMNVTFNELKDLIAAELSVEEILDILGWETVELVDALEDHIKEAEEEFKRAVR